MTIQTYLPLFNGFYNTVFCPNDELYNLESIGDIKEDCYEFNNNEYCKDVSIYACEFIEKNVPFIKKVVFEDVISPKEYNYSTDTINCEIEYDYRKMVKFISDNYDEFIETCKENLSLFENSFRLGKELKDLVRYVSYGHKEKIWADFRSLVKDELELFNLVIETYCRIEGITTYGMYHYVSDYINILEYCTDIPYEDVLDDVVLVYENSNQLKLF